MPPNNFPTQLKRSLDQLAKTSLLRGTFVAQTATGGTCDVHGGRIPVYLTDYLPEIGENVWLLFVRDVVVVIGSAQSKPATGTIAAAPSGGFVAVTINGAIVQCRYAQGLTLQAGQLVQLGRANGDPFVYAVSSASSVPLTPPPPPPPPSSGGSGGSSSGSGSTAGPVKRSTTFKATDTCSFYTGRGRANDNVYDSSSLVGCWFYGTVIADSIGNSATINSAQIYLPALQVMYGNPRLGTHSAANRPATSPAVSNPRQIGGRQGWVDITSTGILTTLKATAGGIGTDHGGYNIYKSRAQDAMTGALKVTWTE